MGSGALKQLVKILHEVSGKIREMSREKKTKDSERKS